MSSKFKSKADVHAKPWGVKDPVFYDVWEDSKLAMLRNRDAKRGAFEKGVWYYSGIGLTDHHDIAGFVNYLNVP